MECEAIMQSGGYWARRCKYKAKYRIKTPYYDGFACGYHKRMWNPRAVTLMAINSTDTEADA